MSKAECWLVVDYLLIKDKGEWLDMSGTTLLQFEIQKFRTGSRSLIEYDNLLKIIQLPYFVFSDTWFNTYKPILQNMTLSPSLTQFQAAVTWLHVLEHVQ